MDFQSALQFAGAIIVVVGAGIVLGLNIRPKDHEAVEGIQARKTILYAEIVMGMDNLAQSSNEHKQYFIQRYYQVLVYAPDKVVRALNAYLLAATHDGEPEKLLKARDEAVMAMRQDVASVLGKSSKLKLSELQTIEIENRKPETANPLTKKTSK